MWIRWKHLTRQSGQIMAIIYIYCNAFAACAESLIIMNDSLRLYSLGQSATQAMTLYYKHEYQTTRFDPYIYAFLATAFSKHIEIEPGTSDYVYNTGEAAVY